MNAPEAGDYERPPVDDEAAQPQSDAARQTDLGAAVLDEMIPDWADLITGDNLRAVGKALGPEFARLWSIKVVERLIERGRS